MFNVPEATAMPMQYACRSCDYICVCTLFNMTSGVYYTVMYVHTYIHT